MFVFTSAVIFRGSWEIKTNFRHQQKERHKLAIRQWNVVIVILIDTKNAPSWVVTACWNFVVEQGLEETRLWWFSKFKWLDKRWKMLFNSISKIGSIEEWRYQLDQVSNGKSAIISLICLFEKLLLWIFANCKLTLRTNVFVNCRCRKCFLNSCSGQFLQIVVSIFFILKWWS